MIFSPNTPSAAATNTASSSAVRAADAEDTARAAVYEVYDAVCAHRKLDMRQHRTNPKTRDTDQSREEKAALAECGGSLRAKKDNSTST